MNRRIDLFVAADAPIGAVAATIARVGGFGVGAPGADGSIELHRDDLVAKLSEHDLPDGEELRLSDYRYVFSTTADVAGHLGDAPETLQLRRLAAALAGAARGALLVLDLPRPGQDGPADPSAGSARSW